MRRTDVQYRGSGLAAATTTLVALVAMAAAYPTPSGSGTARTPHGEVAIARGEAQAVRAVAAVMAAAARDLLAGTTLSAALPALAAPDETTLPVATGRVVVEPRPGAGRPPLAERLLDLPPPC